MKRVSLSAVAVICALLMGSCGGSSTPQDPFSSADFDSFFGYKIFRLTPTGFFRVEQVNGVWWFITPEGHPFLSIGVNSVSPYGYYVEELGYSPYYKAVMEKYGSEMNWARETVRRLVSWNFNTLGAWSSFDLLEAVEIDAPEVDDLRFSAESQVMRVPYTVILYTSGSSWLRGNVVDFFSRQFRDHAFKVAEEYCSKLSSDPYLIGYFLDNEMRWGIDWRGAKTFFQEYFSLPSTAPGKVALVEFLKERYQGDVEAFASAWCTSVSSFEDLLELSSLSGCKPETDRARQDRSAFLEFAAREYFRVSREAIKTYDPNHLILGARIQALIAPPEVVRACGEFCDVVSINFYELEGPLEEWISRLGEAMGYPTGFLSFENAFEMFYQVSGKPFLISEFGYRAADSGLPNTDPPGFLTLPTQKERAEKFRLFVEDVISKPWVVGYHWFSWVDEPPQGRFDGENSNWGIVRDNDEPYQELVEVMSDVNERSWRLHLNARD